MTDYNKAIEILIKRMEKYDIRSSVIRKRGYIIDIHKIQTEFIES